MIRTRVYGLVAQRPRQARWVRQGAILVPRPAPITPQKIVVIIEPHDIGTDMMTKALNGIPCKGRTIISVDYPTTSDPSSGTSTEGTGGGTIAAGVTALDVILKTAPVSQATDVLVFGYSMGAQVASAWLRLHAKDTNRPDPRYVKFLLIGNPERKYGGIPSSRVAATVAKTPNNTVYAVQDLKIQYDGWADWPTTLPRPNWQSIQNAVQGMHTTHLTDYATHNPSDATMFYTENTTVYAMIPNNLPMFDGYRSVGQNAMADKLQAQIQPLIETQYVRPESLPAVEVPAHALSSTRSGQLVRSPFRRPVSRPTTTHRTWH